jgi:dCMP deaminase
MNKWTDRYLEMAKLVSTWSKDPSSKIGAVVVGENGQILTQGYNGFARGIKDTYNRLSNREEKYSHIIHAEMNCIYNASLSGTSLKNGHLYVYGLPVCHLCAPGIIQVGINKIVMQYDPNKPGNWGESGRLARERFKEAGIPHFALDLEGNVING